MAADPIPDSVRELVRARLSSAYEIDALVFLVRSPTPVSPTEAARHLVVTASHAERLLEALVQQRVADCVDGRYSFHPATGRDRKAATELAAVYDTYRLRLARIVYSDTDDG
jgi:DNA-binding IclR family transcriptional regulator